MTEALGVWGTEPQYWSGGGGLSAEGATTLVWESIAEF